MKTTRHLIKSISLVVLLLFVKIQTTKAQKVMTHNDSITVAMWELYEETKRNKDKLDPKLITKEMRAQRKKEKEALKLLKQQEKQKNENTDTVNKPKGQKTTYSLKSETYGDGLRTESILDPFTIQNPNDMSIMPQQGMLHVIGCGDNSQGTGNAFASFEHGGGNLQSWSAGARDYGNGFSISQSKNLMQNVRMFIREDNGFCGIGQNWDVLHPQSQLHVFGDISLTGNIDGRRPGGYLFMHANGWSSGSGGLMLFSKHLGGGVDIVAGPENPDQSNYYEGIRFMNFNEDKQIWEKNMQIKNNGKIIIGVNDTKEHQLYVYGKSNLYGKCHVSGEFAIYDENSNIQYKIERNGYVYARQVEVMATAFPDYVFMPGYRLMPLSELETYIQSHGHLPGMPTEQEVTENGLNLGDVSTILVEKVEELTLYMIELKKENEELRKEIEELKKNSRN